MSPCTAAFTVTRPLNGHVARSSAPRAAIEHFTQAELMAGQIVFAHDGASASEAGFEVVVADKSGATSGAQGSRRTATPG